MARTRALETPVRPFHVSVGVFETPEPAVGRSEISARGALGERVAVFRGRVHGCPMDHECLVVMRSVPEAATQCDRQPDRHIESARIDSQPGDKPEVAAFVLEPPGAVVRIFVTCRRSRGVMVEQAIQRRFALGTEVLGGTEFDRVRPEQIVHRVSAVRNFDHMRAAQHPQHRAGLRLLDTQQCAHGCLVEVVSGVQADQAESVRGVRCQLVVGPGEHGAYIRTRIAAGIENLQRRPVSGQFGGELHDRLPARLRWCFVHQLGHEPDRQRETGATPDQGPRRIGIALNPAARRSAEQLERLGFHETLQRYPQGTVPGRESG